MPIDYDFTPTWGDYLSGPLTLVQPILSLVVLGATLYVMCMLLGYLYTVSTGAARNHRPVPPLGSAALKMCEFFGGGECTTRGELVDGLCSKHQAARGPIFDVATTEGMLDYLEALAGATSEDEVDRLAGRLPVEPTPVSGLRVWEPSRAAWAALAALHVFTIVGCLVGLTVALVAGHAFVIGALIGAAVVNALMLPSAVRNAVR